ncbi:MAG: HAD family hydrolase [Rhizobiaceae bacterium]|nr:HAD family hydrolase [Rhizobiaceae bacterium]
MLRTIAFDADDTLWQNEHYYKISQARFASLLSDRADAAQVEKCLLEAEKRNIGRYGFGIKGFTLSMIETALELSDGNADAAKIRDIIEIGREQLVHPVDLLPYARETIILLESRYSLLLITKGDLYDQERKIAQSGLGDYFDAIEVVSEKNAGTYDRLFKRHGAGTESSAMVGNSLKSDVLPAIECGGFGIYVPHELTWSYEHAAAPTNDARFREIAHLGELPSTLDWIEAGYA